jgi:hypothetical protein
MPSVPIVMYTLYKTEELGSAAKLVGVRAVVAIAAELEKLLWADAVITRLACVPLLTFRRFRLSVWRKPTRLFCPAPGVRLPRGEP